MPRVVRVVLCDASGAVLGQLPEFEVEPQWWPEAWPIVAGVRGRYGAEISVLRLLTADSPSDEMGGHVSYLAELLTPNLPSALEPSPYDGGLAADHPLRARWARPGGIAATVAWADAALADLGRPRTSQVEQLKTWNLSSIVRLPTAAGDVWCKSTPTFFAHEGPVIAMIAADDPTLVPPLLAFDRSHSTVLLGDVPGEDQWQAPIERLIEMVHRLVRLQASWADRTETLSDAGLWDWRAAGFAARVVQLIHRPEVRQDLSSPELDAVDALVTDLPHRLDALADCGLPETLTHGDFHPGNWRYGDRGLVLLDWGDAGVGHPMLDFAAFLPRLAADHQPVVRAAWVEAWRRARPDSNPQRAADLIGPIAALRQAALYRDFLDAIEPDERPYHADDPARWLRLAVDAAIEAAGRSAARR